MKAKSLHFSKNNMVQPIASELGRVHQCVCDQIPPAYPCEGEKVIFIGVELGKKLPTQVENFCRDLNPSRAKSVAFYVVNGDGNTEALNGIKSTLQGNGVQVVGDVLSIKVKSSLFKKGAPTQADIDSAIKWSQDIVDNKLG